MTVTIEDATGENWGRLYVSSNEVREASIRLGLHNVDKSMIDKEIYLKIDWKNR